MGTDLKGKKLPMGISQRKDGRYVGRYTDRFGKRRVIYGKTVRTLQKELAEAIYKDSIGQSAYPEIQLKDWYVKWEDLYMPQLGFSLSTKTNYERYYRKYIDKYMGHMKVGEIHAIHIREFFSNLAEIENLGPGTISGVKGMLSNLLNAAVENDMIPRNPVRGITVPKNKEPRVVPALTREEQELLIKECEGSPYQNFIRCQISSGMRCGELAAVKPENLDFDKKIIRVMGNIAYRQTDNGMRYFLTKPKTKTSIRKIPMSKLFLESIAGEISEGRKLSHRFDRTEVDGVVFVTKHGCPVCPQYYDTELKKIARSISEKYSIDFPMFTSHTLRHTFCTRLIENNANPKHVQVVMGHSSVRQTMERYAHAQEAYLLDMVNEINDVF